MTLRGRLTTAFLAAVLGPVLLGASFVAATVTTVSHQRAEERLRLAAATVRDSVGSLCQQLRAVASAVPELVPADSAVKTFELINLIKAWRLTDTSITPRAIALRSATEGVDGRFVDFFSIEAPVDVRPRLVLTYVPRPAPGLP